MKLNYSENYFGNLHGTNMNENIPFVLPLDYALQSLIQQNFNSFLLTTGCNTVGIYFMTNGFAKVFDSHARDSHGMLSSNGTCVLFELNTMSQLVEYFKDLYQSNILFELRGVKFTCEQFQQISTNLQAVDISELSFSKCPSLTNNTFNASGQSCAICLYSICFSIISSCSYWNDSTLQAVAKHGILAYEEALNNGNEISCNYLPQVMIIYGANIDVVLDSRYQGNLCINSVSSKIALEKMIIDNTKENTGFLIWLSNICLACIFQHSRDKRHKGTKYFLLKSDDKQTINIFKKVNENQCIVSEFCDIKTQNFQCQNLEYIIQFLSCCSQITKSERVKIVRKHKSSAEKRLLLGKRRNNYINMEPVKKKMILANCALRYKTDPILKKNKVATERKKYRSLNPSNKKSLLDRYAKKYKSMNATDKKLRVEFEVRKVIQKYKSMLPNEKRDFLAKKATKYKSIALNKKRDV